MSLASAQPSYRPEQHCTQASANSGAEFDEGTGCNGPQRFEILSMIVRQERSEHSLENYQLQLRLLEQQNKKRLDIARNEQRTVVLSRQRIHNKFKLTPNTPSLSESPASIKPSPVFSSATSSPRFHDCIQKSPESFKQSPFYQTAYSSPVFLSELLSQTSNGRRIELPASEYLQAAGDRGLILPPDLELNWSGRENGGQHVEFAKREKVPLEVINKIGMSLTATIDKVRCRRIMLARKAMTFGRRLSIEESLVEVEHLQKLRHAHIIQLVGSYLQGKTFAVLLYPVADCDLGVFLEEVLDSVVDGRTAAIEYQSRLAIMSLWNFFGCLSEALVYIHSQATKHLDVKPGNILVKRYPDYQLGHRVYIADFGISRCFPSLDHSQTDAPVPRTPKYCAPEVWNREMYGRAADIFSLGCVFMEMLTTLCGRDLDDFAEHRFKDGNGNGAYHKTLPAVHKWATQLQEIPHQPCLNDGSDDLEPTLENAGDGALVFKSDNIWLDATLEMLAEHPEKRKISWVPLYLDGETCSSCDGVREKYREEC
jgi:hypothetical protein